MYALSLQCPCDAPTFAVKIKCKREWFCTEVHCFSTSYSHFANISLLVNDWVSNFQFYVCLSLSKCQFYYPWVRVSAPVLESVKVSCVSHTGGDTVSTAMA